MMDMQSGLAFGSLLISGAGFAAAVLFQNYKAAVAYGRLLQQVEDLKDSGDGHNELSRQFAAFKGEMTAELRNQTGKIDGLVQELSWLRHVTDTSATPSRSRRGAT